MSLGRRCEISSLGIFTLRFLGAEAQRNFQRRNRALARPVELQVIKRVCRTVPCVKLEIGSVFDAPPLSGLLQRSAGALAENALGDWRWKARGPHPSSCRCCSFCSCRRPSCAVVVCPCVVVAAGLAQWFSVCCLVSDSTSWFLSGPGCSFARCCRWRPAEAFFGNRGWPPRRPLL